MKKQTLSAVVLLAALLLCPARAEVLYENTFADGAEGWELQGKAELSDTARRAGMQSLRISQWEDAERDSQWLSPPIPNPGKPVTIGFWAADNYLRCDDFSYSATVDLVDCDAGGKEIRTTAEFLPVVWNHKRKQGVIWGQLLPEGLVWRYYRTVYTPREKTFRIKWHWPKAIARGDAYLTELRIAEAAAGAPAAGTPDAEPDPEAPESRFELEISTPVGANLFPLDAPLRFEALLYTADGEPLAAPPEAELKWDVSDYQRFAVASGVQPFDGAAPVSDDSFYNSPQGRQRKHNLHKTFTVAAPEAAQPGREFFIRAVLVSRGERLAEDTVTYGVVNPRKLGKSETADAHFASGYFRQAWSIENDAFEDASIAEKLGIVWDQVYDYNWKRSQPRYPGPIDFGEPLPAFPRLTFCPNIEQIRGRDDDHPWGSCATMVPEGATMPDPLRPGKTTFQIDPYVEYIVAYVRHHRRAVGRVVPSGLERQIDARTVELHKKVYIALKKEFPELPVGIMLYGLFSNPSKDVDIFFEEKLYEFADFIDSHFYASAADWSEWHRLQRTLEKLGRPPLPFYSTEFAVVGGSDQAARSRSMIAGHLDAFANGLTHIYYFNQNNLHALPDPFLRGPTDLGGTQTSGFMLLQRIDRPRVSDLIVCSDPKRRWGRGSYDWEPPGESLMPTLSTLTYHNLIRVFDTAAHRATLTPTPNSIVYVFDRADITVAAVWLTNPVGYETFAVRSPVPFSVRDLYGREERIAPRDGVALLSANQDPLMLEFEGSAPALSFEPLQGGLESCRIPRGGAGSVALTVPAVFETRVKAEVTCTVDGTWPAVDDRAVTLAPGRTAKAALEMSVSPDRAVGAYPLTARLAADGEQIGLLRSELRVQERLTAEVEAVPLTRTQAPALRVAVRSLRDQPSAGVVKFENRYFADAMQPRQLEQPYTLEPRGTAEVGFPLPRELVNLTADYEVEVAVHDTSGIRFVEQEQVGFRATPRAPGAIAVDGELSDWKLDLQTPVPFERRFTSWGKPYGGPADIGGEVYTLWDDEFLYFAAIVTDDSAVIRADDVGIWQDDNIMFGLYPWGWSLGETANSGYYREHLGLCGDGEARIFRVGNVTGGPATAEGARIAVTREADRFIYEWAYPRASIYPATLEPGARFRVSVTAMDRDGPDPGKGQRWPLGGVQLGGFNVNVDARPLRWREFVLVE